MNRNQKGLTRGLTSVMLYSVGGETRQAMQNGNKQVISMSISATGGTPEQPHMIEGDSSAAVVHLYTNVGFTSVEWYVNDTLVETHTGNGTGKYDSLSGYDFAGFGSTTGNRVTIKAVAKRRSGGVSSQATGYNYITVWTSPQDAITPSISISDDLGPGGTFEFTVTLASPNKHYHIDPDSLEVTVEAGGETIPSTIEVVGAGAGVTGVVMKIAGFMKNHPGKWALIKVSVKSTLVVGAIFTVTDVGIRYWHHRKIRSLIQGILRCASDDEALGHGLKLVKGKKKYESVEALVKCFDFDGYVEYDNPIQASPLKPVPLGKPGTGTFTFENVPCGKVVTVMGMSARNYHDHGGGHRWVRYGASSAYKAGPIGTKGAWYPFGEIGMPGGIHIGSIRMNPMP